MTVDRSRTIDPEHDPAWPGERTDGATSDDAFRVPFSIGVGLAMVVWTVLAQVLVGSVFATAGADFDDALTLRVIVVASQLATALGAVAFLRSTGRWSWRLLGPSRPRWRDVGLGVATGLAGYALVLGWILLFTLVFGEPDPVDQALLDGVDTSAGVLVLSVVAAVLFAPVIEEFVFRGVLFQAVRRHLGLRVAVAFSAVVFTAVHVELYPPLGAWQPVAVFALLLLGAWLGWAFHKAGSIVVPIVGHLVFNAINLSIAIGGG